MDIAFLKLQVDRCQRLSRGCINLGTAQELRLMGEEYLVEAAKIEAIQPQLEPPSH